MADTEPLFVLDFVAWSNFLKSLREVRELELEALELGLSVFLGKEKLTDLEVELLPLLLGLRAEKSRVVK